MSTTTARLIAVFFAASLIVACDGPARQSSEASGPKVGDTFQGGKIVSIKPVSDSPQSTIGRYVFYMEAGGGYLLDSATGDMWLMGHNIENGKIVPGVLLPIKREPHTPQTAPVDFVYDPTTKTLKKPK